MNKELFTYPFILHQGCYFHQAEPVEWVRLLRFLQGNAGETFQVYIPVDKSSFGDLGRFSSQIPALVERGYAYGFAVFKGNAVEVLYCVEEGSHGDEDGYGVEPDEWITGKMNLEGSFTVPFHPA